MSELAKIEKTIKLYEEEGLDKLKPEKYREMLDKVAALKTVEHSGYVVRNIHKEAELVLQTLSSPDLVRNVTCPECGGVFLTNYAYQQYCSFDCLKEKLEEKGLAWDPSKPPSQRWQGEPPSTISPETLRVLKKWAKRIVEGEEDVERNETRGVPVSSDNALDSALSSILLGLE